ncbi:dynein regulatory complex protein 8 isoform X3 [Symphalangus syndactylus]|uniref:dynein regulatory complex protein 8 isoform X3 n=1 Tax=Symphalangus syndactylus TaxID=9590 RepID=UPI003006140A
MGEDPSGMAWAIPLVINDFTQAVSSHKLWSFKTAWLLPPHSLSILFWPCDVSVAPSPSTMIGSSLRPPKKPTRCQHHASCTACRTVEEEEPTGYIRFEKFLPVMTEILLERKYRPIPEDVLLRAFEVLDSAKRGFLTKDELIKYMTDEDVIVAVPSNRKLNP